ncbi:MAG TPA: UDP-2,3-diacylglucosamine diphosphatase [Thermoanaerobaculia bacterium]|nr:UDP-2,3-diacylglucosamine diphosphatase [Thermoanaerobaculia bacterium]HXT51993.1 UDP-2,3-diacylglucosamine diphosphatase [Thermoanaerobaculia bacterium]
MTEDRRLAIVADAHLDGPGGAAGPLIGQLRTLLEQGCERLLFMGDLFQAWVGYPQFEPPGLAELLAVVSELRARGIRVDYLEGNRDFFLAGSPYATFFDFVGDEVAFVAGGVRYLAVHGDGLDDKDVQYRLWRRATKSLPVRLLMRFLPARLARRLVDSTERKLAQTNFKHRVAIPTAAIERFAARRLREGHDVLLLGHFHEERRWAVPGGEVWLLPAWFQTRQVQWIGGEGPGEHAAAG